MPPVCSPSDEAVASQACGVCGNRDWDTSSRTETRCTVFLLAALVFTTFVSYRCNHHDSDGKRCGGMLEVDGKEHGLLRFRRHIAFGHCLLYAWADRMVTGGVKWWRFWRDTLMAYKTCVIACSEYAIPRSQQVWFHVRQQPAVLMCTTFHHKLIAPHSLITDL